MLTESPPGPRPSPLRRLVLSIVLLVAVLLPPGSVSAQENPLEPLDTSSPQATYVSFVEQAELLEELLADYERNRSERSQAAFTSALDELEVLFDFSEVADANREEVAVSAFAALADILNRLPPIDVADIPDADDVEESQTRELEFAEDGLPQLAPAGITQYRLPGTEITIERIDEGAREGDFVFSSDTVASLPGWRDEVDDLPVRDGVRVGDWTDEQAEFTGHLVPRSVIDGLPDTFDRLVLGTPLWKLLADVVLLAALGALTWTWRRLIGRRGEPGTVAHFALRITTPGLLALGAVATRRFMNEQINHSGDAATLMNTIVTGLTWIAFAWAFWFAVKLVVEWIIATPSIKDESVDAHLLRLVGKVLGVIGVALTVWVGLSRIGISSVGLGVSAGVLGLAVGLAATGTLENLIGGITVYADKPFSVGDWIIVDGDFGTVEEIGPRSTSVRRLDDTKVTLPNADASRLKIINFSHRRHIQFLHVIGVRYETTTEQLRTIVGALDARFREHPMVLEDENHPRVRVVGFGSSSIDIEIRARIDTHEFPEFQRVQEELLLLTVEIVEAAGSGFAFPSSTTYLADDAGMPEATHDALLDPVTGSSQRSGHSRDDSGSQRLPPRVAPDA